MRSPRTPGERPTCSDPTTGWTGSEIGIIGKGLDGAAELLGGLLLLWASPDRIRHLAVVLIFDAFVLALTAGEYRRQRQHRQEYAGAEIS
jgi:uncharacterized membrane protein